MIPTTHIATDVLVVGSGAAGMYAAIEAAQRGARALLIDRSLIGRGGATVMAQMTVAGALGGADVANHLSDTLAAGRDLCDEALARLLCEEAPDCIRAMDDWGVGWARNGTEHKLVLAPGHDKPRCVYVEFLATGTALSQTLRKQLIRSDGVRRVGEIVITDLALQGGRCVGAHGLHLPTGATVTIAAAATIIATGGLTRLYARNSASANMGGDGYALALRAGAELIDMEFVQFFPIGHLAPRLIGMDPIMWDAFRYKLGGRLLNGRMEEFVHRYGEASDQYTLTRDQATYAIVKEVEAGRGSPHGGAWLSFTHCSAVALREEFGPVIDRLAQNGIDLCKDVVEVAPIAHYHMGGVRVDRDMRTCVPGLLAAGEAVGGANGANRLSGNAVSEALVFGRVAGRVAAEEAARRTQHAAWDGQGAPADSASASEAPVANLAALIAELQTLMSARVGPFRTQQGLCDALTQIASLRASSGASAPAGSDPLTQLLDWLDLRNMLLTAEAVTCAALARTESRGAHQREDHPGMEAAWRVNLVQSLADGGLRTRGEPVRRQAVAPLA